MPSVARVRAELKGADALDTAARQMGAFEQLMGIINVLAGPRYKSLEFTPDENRLRGNYFDAWQRFHYRENAPPPQDQPRWAKLHAFYETDPGFRDELLQQFFSAEVRAAYYRAAGETPSSSQPPVQVASGTATTPSPPAAPPATSAEAYNAQGDKHLEAKDYAQAIEAYHKAIAMNPSLVTAHRGLGQTYFRQQNYPLAITSYQKCLSLNSNDATCFLDLGTAFSNLKRYDDALTLYASTASRKLYPEDAAEAHYKAGWIHVLLRQYQNAFEPLQAVLRVQLEPESHWHGYALTAMGLAHLRLQQSPQAVATLQRAVRLLPAVEEGLGMYPYNVQAAAVGGIDSVSTHYLLGQAYVGVGDKAGAQQVYRTIQKLPGLTEDDRKQAQELLAAINKMN